MISPAESTDYDVVVIGGALSGAATATLLRRRDPAMRVLIVEKSDEFSRRVGEATVEVSGYFLGRVLGLTQYLNESHLVKQGLRFYFTNEKVASLAEASEIGPGYQVRLPSYQVDRATLDEEVLRRAAAGGVELLRPASVTGVNLHPGGAQQVTISHDGESRTVRARWIVDASGVAALLARKNGWWRPNTKHPTAACWSRWRGVKDWDGRELAEKFPCWAKAVHGIRGTATNHVIGPGWWSWWIPLKGGDISVGVVFDQRLVDWPQDGAPLGARLKQFLMRHPVGREMLADATYDESDVHWRKNLAYYSTTFAGDGFVLVGDAAAFMDPFYSPGMDWISFTAGSAAALIADGLAGKPMEARIEAHNRDFAASHRRWFEALYKDKYEYMGEYDLMNLAFLLDLGLYYFGVVSQPFKHGEAAFTQPPFSLPIARPFHAVMSFYNKRLAAIARRRRELGTCGRKNRNMRTLLPGYSLANRSNWAQLLRAFARWGWLELIEGWHTWNRPLPTTAPMAAQAGASR